MRKQVYSLKISVSPLEKVQRNTTVGWMQVFQTSLLTWLCNLARRVKAVQAKAVQAKETSRDKAASRGLNKGNSLAS